ncbi:MAG: zinc ribbon domain-containing protein [Bacillota bacterium]
MPIYEFRCTNCHEKFELLCKHGEQIVCPNCDSREVVKMFSTFSSPSVRTSSCSSCKSSSCSDCK